MILWTNLSTNCDNPCALYELNTATSWQLNWPALHQIQDVKVLANDIEPAVDRKTYGGRYEASSNARLFFVDHLFKQLLVGGCNSSEQDKSIDQPFQIWRKNMGKNTREKPSNQYVSAVQDTPRFPRCWGPPNAGGWFQPHPTVAASQNGYPRNILKHIHKFLKP